MDNRTLLAGAGVGAALAFALDPDSGGRRRALMRDKLVRGSRMTGRAIGQTACDLTNRARGIVAATRGRTEAEQVDEHTLVERVRAKLGRACSHPRAIDVEARGGEVTLRGAILARELDDVLAAVGAVRGVTAVMDELKPHESSQGLPSLQGSGRVPGSTFDLLQRRWSPATRALVGLAAVAAGGLVLASANR